MSVYFQRTTRYYITEDRTLHNHSYENLKSPFASVKMLAEHGSAHTCEHLGVTATYLKMAYELSAAV